VITRATSMKGLTLAAFSALTLSVITTAATFAYKGGMDAVTLVAARALAGFLSAAFFVACLRRVPRIAPKMGLITIGMSVSQLMINFGYMASVFFIPVSLAALIFYSFPVLVLIIDAIAKHRFPPLGVTLAFVIALGGLTIALGPSFNTLNGFGLFSAGLASIGGALLIIFGVKLTRRAGALATFFHLQLIACGVTTYIMLLFGGPALPVAKLGWCALMVACVAYVVGVGTQVVALKILEPAPAALIYNLEPIGTLAIAAWLLNERLSPLQYFGCAMVIAAITIAGQGWAKKTANDSAED